MRIAFALLLPFALVTGCSDAGSSEGAAGDPCTAAGYRCASSACYVHPENPGCVDVAPSLGHCPLSAPHCFNPRAPSLSQYYCDPVGNQGVCGTPKMGAPADCPGTPCSMSDVARCYDTTSDDFCRSPAGCVHFGCTQDGGAGDGGGNVDGASGGG